MDDALKLFEAAEQSARRANDQKSVSHALEFQRAAHMATLNHECVAEILGQIAELGPASSAEARVTTLLAGAGIHMASGRFDMAASELDLAASICADEGLSGSRVEQLRAIGEFLEIGSSVAAQQSLRFGDIEHARNYWLSVVKANSGENESPGFELRQARGFYYLSRLRYLEWHGTRQNWVRVYTGPTLGRSASYEVRRDKHTLRCEQYREDVKSYNQDASSVNRLPPGSALDLVERERQLRIEFESLKQLGGRLQEEHKAKSVNQSQLSGRATRDLSQLLHEARQLAERSTDRLLTLSAGPVDNYDPNLHYLALSNLSEILFAQLATTSWSESAGPAIDDAYRKTLIGAIDALEKAAGLISHPAATKFGAHADAERFIDSFETVPSIVLLNFLEKHVRENGDRAPPNSLERLRLIAGQLPAIKE
jgi:hypothetical protein